MFRFLVFVVAFALGLSQTATAAGELPARPTPFTFVTDKAQLLSETDAKKLENGLRTYADNNGTQVVVVTVPTLEGRTVADYARALGTAWGVGQRNQNNGVMVLIAAQEHQVSIQAGSGLRSQITPALTDRIISQQMGPQFKQGRYFAGLRAGLNTLLQAANPGSAPTSAPAATAPATADAPVASAPVDAPIEQPYSAPFSPGVSSPTPEPSGPGMGTLLLGVVAIGGVIWLLVKLFRRKSSTPNTTGNTPDFLPNRTNQPTQGYSQGAQRPTPDFFNRGGNGGNNNNNGGGSGIGGMLATGAAAAAGAYLGNRMASGQSHTGNDLQLGNDNTAAAGLGAAGAGLGATPPASDAEVNDFFGGAGAVNDPGPDYFSDDVSSGPDYFSSDNSYNDPSSDDTGGGGFDDSSDNSGSW